METLVRYGLELNSFPANIYLLKVNNRNTIKWGEICSKLTINRQSEVIDVVLVFLLLILNIFDTFQLNVSCVISTQCNLLIHHTKEFLARGQPL